MTHLYETVYGSHLYGTNTPTSDVDKKVIYLPSLDSVLLGEKMSIFKERKDADGNPVAVDVSMPDNGTEVEFIPFQAFAWDYLNGQTYALEVGWSAVMRADEPHWMLELRENFTTCNVSSMAGFAMKQTFDYVHRGRRLEAAEETLQSLEYWLGVLQDIENMNPGLYKKMRLDSILPSGEKILHLVAHETGLSLGSSVNNNRTLELLKLNGREYLETTDLSHLITAVKKLIGEYGVRSTNAKENDVDPKSLMHAVRVYEQALELLNTGRITFPRPNPSYLLAVKHLAISHEEVKTRLLELEAELQEAQKNPTFPQRTKDQLLSSFKVWYLTTIKGLYNL